LSDKAKGKRRALPDDHNNEEDGSSNNASGLGSRKKAVEEERGRSITFRFTGEAVDLGDLDVWVDAGESVGRVKDKVRIVSPTTYILPSTQMFGSVGCR
jgi:hypothetical protein